MSFIYVVEGFFLLMWKVSSIDACPFLTMLWSNLLILSRLDILSLFFIKMTTIEINVTKIRSVPAKISVLQNKSNYMLYQFILFSFS